MNFLRFILIIGIFLKEHVGSVELQWDVPQSRKLLMTGGVLEEALKDKVASVTAGGKTYTGVSWKGCVMIPGDLGKEPVVKKGDGATEVKGGSSKVAAGYTFITGLKLTDLESGKEPATGSTCKVLGLEGGKAATIACTVTAVEEKMFTCKAASQLCATDIGAGVLCSDKLAGILKTKAAGGGGGGEAGGEEEKKKPAARRKRAEPEGEGEKGAGAGGGADCSEAYEAVNIVEVERLIKTEGGVGFASNLRPTYILASIPVVILLSFIFVH